MKSIAVFLIVLFIIPAPAFAECISLNGRVMCDADPTASAVVPPQPVAMTCPAGTSRALDGYGNPAYDAYGRPLCVAPQPQVSTAAVVGAVIGTAILFRVLAGPHHYRGPSRCWHGHR